MTSSGHGNTFSVGVPRHLQGQPFGRCQTYFGERFSATLLAVRQDGQLVVSPDWNSPVHAGALLYYVALARVDPARLTVPA